MKLCWQLETLRTHVPFVTSHGGGDRFDTVLVEVAHAGTVGYGEASPTRYHGETAATVMAALERLAPAVEEVGDPGAIQTVHEAMDEALAGHRSARAAIDIACHDWLGKRYGVPLWRLLGVDLSRAPESSYTVAIGDAAAVAASLEHGADFRALKVKMGDEDDVERLRAVRAASPLPIRVDANGGWRFEDAMARLAELELAEVELLEQPFEPRARQLTAKLWAHAALPIIVDEPIRVARDVHDWVDRVDGVNVKLAKCGGVRPALALIHTARALGLRVMLGCMVESSIGIAAAAALSPLCDWVDLDGFRLIAGDPARGLRLVDGRVLPSDDPGLGVELARPIAPPAGGAKGSRSVAD